MFVDPPISRQKTVHKSKPDGSRETSHTIEHDTTVGALRNARKGRGDKRPMKRSPFRSLEYIATHAHPPAITEDGKARHYEDGTTARGMTDLVDDRRGAADPRLERPAPRDRQRRGELEDMAPDPSIYMGPQTSHAGLAALQTLAKLRGDARLERPAPANAAAGGFGDPYSDIDTGRFAPGEAGDVSPVSTVNPWTLIDRYYNPPDEFDDPTDFEQGLTAAARRKNRNKRPSSDIFDAVTAGLRRAR